MKVKDAVLSMEALSEAQEEAEKRGKHEFVCPLCGGEAWWFRVPGNKHLRCGCRKCGIRMME